MRKWLQLLYGPVGEVTSVERDKPDGFVAAICSQAIVAFDNVDEHVGWLANYLAQVATGISFKRRELYTTNSMIEFRPQCFIALNARTPKFIERRDDVLDRTLTLHAQRFNSFSGENEILQNIADNRNSLWTELLRELNSLLALNRRERSFIPGRAISRMADFEGFAFAVARAEGATECATRVFESMQRHRNDSVLGEEPIVLCLNEWVKVPENGEREVSSATLQEELARIAIGIGIKWPYPSAKSLGQRLANIRSNLSSVFNITSRHDSANQLRYYIMPKAESPNLSESTIPENQAA